MFDWCCPGFWFYFYSLSVDICMCFSMFAMFPNHFKCLDFTIVNISLNLMKSFWTCLIEMFTLTIFVETLAASFSRWYFNHQCSMSSFLSNLIFRMIYRIKRIIFWSKMLSFDGSIVIKILISGLNGKCRFPRWNILNNFWIAVWHIIFLCPESVWWFLLALLQ